jgi:Zn-dependent M28 family amino/carboxypeptidase
MIEKARHVLLWSPKLEKQIGFLIERAERMGGRGALLADGCLCRLTGRVPASQQTRKQAADVLRTGLASGEKRARQIMEAMRLLKVTGAPLKRTVRIGLWNGEEQGLIGSRLYVAQHFGGIRGVPTATNPRGEVGPVKRAHSRFQGYFNIDNGAGAIRGIHSQGNRAIVPILRQWLEPLRDIGATHVSQLTRGGTDHLSFDAAGLPGFQFIQDEIEYDTRTHHSNMDVFDRIQLQDMKQAATIMAAFLYQTATRNEKLPRKP